MLKSLSILVLFIVLAFSVAAVAQGQDSSQSKAGTASSADGVKYFPKDDVMASFAKGGTLVTESNYKVMTAHRTPATEAKVEVHRSYTDVFYIVQGSTTFVTGGKMLGEDEESRRAAWYFDRRWGDTPSVGRRRDYDCGGNSALDEGCPRRPSIFRGEG